MTGGIWQESEWGSAWTDVGEALGRFEIESARAYTKMRRKMAVTTQQRY